MRTSARVDRLFRKRRLPWLVLSAAAYGILVAIQYGLHWVGTSTLLGWDTPAYVWQAQLIARYGPFVMMQAWIYPNVYTQIVAGLGALLGNLFLAEQVLQVLLGIAWIVLTFMLAEEVFDNIPLAGLAALLTAISVNFLRLDSDLHRNTFVIILTLLVFLVLPYLTTRGFQWGDVVVLTVLFLLILATQVETFLTVSVVLLIDSWLFFKPRILNSLVVAVFSSWAIIILVFPRFFLGYVSSIEPFDYQPLFSWNLLVFAGLLVFPAAVWATGTGFIVARRDRDVILASMSLWAGIIYVLTSLLAIGVIPLTPGFAIRTMMLLPVGFLTAFFVSGRWVPVVRPYWTSLRRRLRSRQPFPSSPHAAKRRSLTPAIAILCVAALLAVSLTGIDGFYTTYMTQAESERLDKVAQIVIAEGLDRPIFVFDSAGIAWTVSIVRNDLGARIGDHFAYYGTLHNLSLLQPTIFASSNAVYQNMEQRWSTSYFDELTGRIEGPPGVYVHLSWVRTLADLAQRPVVVVTTDFYDLAIPNRMRGYLVQDGIYVLPPGALLAIRP